MSDDNHSVSNGNGQSRAAASEAEMEAEAAIARLFDDYQAGFNNYEGDRICDCFALPVTIWQNDDGHVFVDEEDLIDNIEALLLSMDKEGITHSDFHVSSSHISGNSAMITLDWSQENDDGEVVRDFTCHYHLIHDGDDWSIALIINE